MGKLFADRLPILFTILGSILCLTACRELKESAKYQFAEDYYKTKIDGKQTRAYVVPGDDTIHVYPQAVLQQNLSDNKPFISIPLPSQRLTPLNSWIFRRNSLDLDVLTILFKYRAPIDSLPRQFTTDFNAAGYIGYRTDVYKVKYSPTPLRHYNRSVTHIGYSFGIFTGVGTVGIGDTNTGGQVNYDYNGLLNLSGIAFMVEVNKLSLGLTAGVDHLLDRNYKYWLNQGKPWLGVSFGLNLN